MERLMSNDFTFKHDFRRIQWLPTLGLNELRAMCSGIVIYLIISIAGGQWTAWPIMLALPFGYLIFILPGFFLCQALARRGVDVAGWIGLILCLEVVAGDPVVFVLRKAFPRLVPVEKFGLLNFAVIIFVLRSEAEAVQASTETRGAEAKLGLLRR